MPTESESNNTILTANRISPSTSFLGQLSSVSDVDYFKVTATGAGTFYFEFNPSIATTYNYYVQVVDKFDSILVSAIVKTELKQIFFSVEQAGDYFLKISNGPGTISYQRYGYSVAYSFEENTPTYRISGTSNFVNEGSLLTFTLTTTNLSAGSVVPYTLSGISNADISGGLLSGSAIVNASGVATISISLLNDALTEGQETLTITAGGTTASTTIYDTSTSSSPIEGKHNLSVLVDKGVLGPLPILLKDLIETVTYKNGALTQHSVQYAGLNFDYYAIDALVTTITRNGEFTAEFNKEINDYLQSETNISYKVAIALVGAQNIDNIILMVAGSDGNYVA